LRQGGKSFFRMFNSLFLASSGGGLGDTARSIGEVFGFNAWAFGAQVFSFSVVCLILYKFAYHPILKVLEERRQLVERSIREAAEVKVHVADAERRATEIVTQASSGAHKLVEEAKQAAQEFTERQVRDARAEAESIVLKAREEAKRDYDRMLGELRGEVARLVVETTAKVVGRVLTEEDQRRLAEAAVNELAA
jgi:F-type H+-transporting ATPase subunit b